MNRVFGWCATLFVLAALAGCGTPPSPVPDARATDVAAQEAVAPTYFAEKNATATVQTALFARVKPLLTVTLAEVGTAPDGTPVEIRVTNGDQAMHTVIIRLYSRSAPLDTRYYAIGKVDLAAGATGSTSVTTTLPFAQVAAQVLQIDGIWDYSAPPTP